MESDSHAMKERLYRSLWKESDAPGDFERMRIAAGLRVTRMVWNGLTYIRIWSMHAPARGIGGGGFDLPVDAIESLASSATSIHIRMQGDESQSITLRPGVVWPLQQLQRGVPFDRTLHGVDVTPSIAKVTWAGSADVLDAMWNRGVQQHQANREEASRSAAMSPGTPGGGGGGAGGVRQGEGLKHGRLYEAVGNAKGLHLVSGQRCELHSGSPAQVEVWLGKLVL